MINRTNFQIVVFQFGRIPSFTDAAYQDIIDVHLPDYCGKLDKFTMGDLSLCVVIHTFTSINCFLQAALIPF